MRRAPLPEPPNPPAEPRRQEGAAPGVGRRGAVLGVAAVLAVFFAPALLGGGDFVYRDTGRMHAPMKRWIGEELAAGRLPQWNPYAALGTPVVANGIDAVQHPFTLLFAILPAAAAMKAWILLSFALAAAGAWVWARQLARGEAARAAAAVAFALSGPLVSSSDNVSYLTTYAALPWVFAAAHRFAAGGGPSALLGVGAAAALCAAAGDPQAWAFAVGLVPLYVLAVAPGPGTRRARRAAGALAAAVIASAPFILPVLAWLPHARRAAGVSVEDRGRWNLHPHRLVELVVPDLMRDDPQDPISVVFRAYAANDVTLIPWFISVYVGAAVAGLAALGAAGSRRARVLAALAMVFAWAALGPYAGFASVAERLPVLRSFRYWEKLAVWIPLLLVPAVAAGAEDLARGVRTRAVALGAAIGAALLLGVATLSAVAPSVVERLAGGPPEAATRFAANVASGAGRAGLVLVLLAGAAVLIERGRLRRAAPAAVAVIVALDLFGGNAGAYVLGPAERPGRPPLAAGLAPGARVFTAFSLREDRWPELGRLGSSWEWERRTLGPSWNVPLRVTTQHDYVGLRGVRWATFVETLTSSGQLARIGLFGFSHAVVPAKPELAAKTGAEAPFRVAATDPELPAFLVEVPHRARAYLAEAPFEAGDGDALAFALGGGRDGRTAVEGPVVAGASGGDAEVVGDLPGDTAVRVRAGGNALLVLNDLFAPGWDALVDGRPAPILRVNGLVRGVWVQAGTHEVRFRYRTPGLALGWAVAFAGALALAVWALARRMAAGGVRGSERERGARDRSTAASA